VLGSAVLHSGAFHTAQSFLCKSAIRKSQSPWDMVAVDVTTPAGPWPHVPGYYEEFWLSWRDDLPSRTIYRRQDDMEVGYWIGFRTSSGFHLIQEPRKRHGASCWLEYSKCQVYTAEGPESLCEQISSCRPSWQMTTQQPVVLKSRDFNLTHWLYQRANLNKHKHGKCGLGLLF